MLQANENFRIHVNGNTQYISGNQYQTQTYIQQPSQSNIFIINSNDQTKITIYQSDASSSSQLYVPPSRIDEVESEGSVSHDSLDEDLVIGNFECKEKEIGIQHDFEPDSLMILPKTDNFNNKMDYSPFKRRLNAPPLRQSKGIKVSIVCQKFMIIFTIFIIRFHV